MEQTIGSLSEKIQTLTSDQVAVVEEFVESLRMSSHIRSSDRLSEPAFAAIWSNPEDDVYDAL